MNKLIILGTCGLCLLLTSCVTTTSRFGTATDSTYSSYPMDTGSTRQAYVNNSAIDEGFDGTPYEL